MRPRVLCAALLCALALSVPSRAQDYTNLDQNARVRLGPVSLKPTLALTNLGVDTNVFYQPDQLDPASDFTLTLTPATELWMRMGRTWIVGNLKEDLVYYQTYSSERSANFDGKLGWVAPLNRLTFKTNGSYLNTRDRPGYEIDVRSRRVEMGGDGNLEIRALSKTFFGLTGRYNKVDYDKDQIFLGEALAYELNRTERSAGLTIRHQLTPLTGLTMELTKQEDRFEFSPLRDADSSRFSGGVKFDPYAMLKGSASVGYRDFQPIDKSLPAYQGLAWTVDLSYVAFGSTKVGIQGMRDVQYSYEINQPYYLQTGATLLVQQQIYGAFDVLGRVGRYRLEYADRGDAQLRVPERVDRVTLWGAGAGYRFGRDLRVGFNADNQERDSVLAFRAYNGLRMGVSVTYGF